jgi:hypothetical protein
LHSADLMVRVSNLAGSRKGLIVSVADISAVARSRVSSATNRQRFGFAGLEEAAIARSHMSHPTGDVSVTAR